MSSMGGQLGDFYVKFGAVGADELKSKMNALKGAFDDAASSGEKVGKATQKAGGGGMLGGIAGGAMVGGAVGAGVGAAMAGVQTVMDAIGSVKDVLMGLAMAGIRGSAEMDHINAILERISKTMASAFAPALDAVDNILQSAEPTIRKIADNVGMWINFLADAAEKLYAGVSPLFDKLNELWTVINDLLLSALDEVVDFIVKVVDVLVNLLVKAIQWLIDIAKDFFDLVGAHHHKSGSRMLGKGGGGFEGIENIFKRVQQSALRVGGGKSQEQLLADIARQTEAGVNFQNFMNTMNAIGDTISGIIQWMKDKWPFGK